MIGRTGMSRFGLVVPMVWLLLIGCGRNWLPDEPQACIFDRECPSDFHCVDGRCLDMDIGRPDDQVELKGFGERCVKHAECLSTYCLTRPAGAFCTIACDDGCPTGWVCRQLPDPHRPGKLVGLCSLDRSRLCAPCVDDAGCDVTGSDWCLEFSDGKFCARDCTYEACPEGHVCTSVQRDGLTAAQCLPVSDSCSCSPDAVGMVRGCERNNSLGVCDGFETCLDNGDWSECSARQPRAEECDGLDDDCDGWVDEELETKSCQRGNSLGTCSGNQVCRGSRGWVCDAPEPAVEACNGLDDDCDGLTDEGFRDEQERYLQVEHCGGCQSDCLALLAHATRAVCLLVNDQPTCRATACEPGYFIFGTGLACMALPDNLCQNCAQDADCLGPGSRCVENGSESYCGRDCAPGSPYGTECPEGYACRPSGDGLQCQPERDTCLCTAEHLGLRRSCIKDACVGYQVCALTGDQPLWSECNLDDFNVEICDSLDNNCDGRIDEGYLNPATGRYDSDQHCGFCNNDCALYWSLELHHTRGVCDASFALPACVMGACERDELDGVPMEWVDVDSNVDNGCECHRLAGNTDVDPPDLIEWPEPGLTYRDENCDGVDGVATDSLFVRAGAIQGDGSRQRPFGTLAEALASWPASGKHTILVAEGMYHEDVKLVAGVRLHGGYSADFASRDVILYASQIIGTGPVAALQAEHVRGTTTLVSGFVIHGRNVDQAPAPAADGASSVSVRLLDCDGSLGLRSNQIIAGRGGDGGAGPSGQAGYGRQMDRLLDGGHGRDGQRNPGECRDQTLPGGASGRNAECPDSSGRAGGTTRCPRFDWQTDPVQGAQAEYHTADQGDGLGGYDWSFDSLSTSSCIHATESGHPTAHQLNVGQDGVDGRDGSSGLGGTGGSGRYGSLNQGLWVPAPTGAFPGSGGLAGTGGGGGGGGGGTAYFYRSEVLDCPYHEIGPSGGGGGAGGCGGFGGQAGGAGGAAIGVLIVQVDGTSPDLVYNVLQRGQGGRGGDGGVGGMGGIGGMGGFGGSPPDWISSQGGKGGDGGNGGPGGGGGGGAGGPSFDLLGFELDTSDLTGANLFVYDQAIATGGAGGLGGGSVGTGASGQAGLSGASGQRLDLRSCAASPCPDGFSCDENDLCVP